MLIKVLSSHPSIEDKVGRVIVQAYSRVDVGVAKCWERVQMSCNQTNCCMLHCRVAPMSQNQAKQSIYEINVGLNTIAFVTYALI